VSHLLPRLSNNPVHSLPVTSTMERIYSLPFQYTSPASVLFSLVRRFEVNRCSSPVWDLHLNHHFQAHWRRFSQRDKIKALIWVVDANHHIRFEEGLYALKDFLDGGDVPQGVPLLVLANKQDLPGAVNVTELARELKLRDIHGRPWHIMVCCVSYTTLARL